MSDEKNKDIEGAVDRLMDEVDNLLARANDGLDRMFSNAGREMRKILPELKKTTASASASQPSAPVTQNSQTSSTKNVEIFPVGHAKKIRELAELVGLDTAKGVPEAALMTHIIFRLRHGSLLRTFGRVDPKHMGPEDAPSEFSAGLCRELGVMDADPAHPVIHDFFVNAMQRARASGAASVAPALSRARENTLRELHKYALQVSELYGGPKDNVPFDAGWKLACKRFIDYAEHGLGLVSSDTSPSECDPSEGDLGPDFDQEFVAGQAYTVKIGDWLELQDAECTGVARDPDIVTLYFKGSYYKYLIEDVQIIKHQPKPAQAE